MDHAMCLVARGLCDVQPCTIYFDISRGQGQAGRGRDVITDFRSVPFHLLPHTPLDSTQQTDAVRSRSCKNTKLKARCLLHTRPRPLPILRPWRFDFRASAAAASRIVQQARSSQPPRAAFHAPQSTLDPSRLTSPRSLALETATCCQVGIDSLRSSSYFLVTSPFRSAHPKPSLHGTRRPWTPQAHGITHSSRRLSSAYEQTRNIITARTALSKRTNDLPFPRARMIPSSAVAMSRSQHDAHLRHSCNHKAP